MILDSFWAGIWIGLMQVSPIPSLFIVSVQIADRYAAGGWKILKPALTWMLTSFLIVWLANDFRYTIEFSTRTVLLSLPLATCYPIVLRVVSRHLSIKLRKRRELLEKQALMDPGLDLPNRRCFEQNMESAFRTTRKKRYCHIFFSLMWIILKRLMILTVMKLVMQCYLVFQRYYASAQEKMISRQGLVVMS